MQKLYTLAQAAELFGGVSASTLGQQVRSGRLEATLIGKTYVVTEAAIEAYRVEHMGKIGRPTGAKDGADVVRKPRRSKDS